MSVEEEPAPAKAEEKVDTKAEAEAPKDATTKLSYKKLPLSYDEYREQLRVTPTKRDIVDEYRMEMDKYRYKWQKYLYKAGEANVTDECDYDCARECFQGTTETTAAELIFFNCLVPKCKCIRHMISHKEIARQRF